MNEQSSILKDSLADAEAHAYISLICLPTEEPTGEPLEGKSGEKDYRLTLGEPHKTFAANNFAVSNEVNCHNYIYIPVKNSKLYVYDLDTKEKADEKETGITTPLGAAITPDGIVYIAGNMQFMYKYDPYNGTGERIDLPNVGAMNYFNINSDESGNLYFGTYPDAKLYRYSPASGTFTEYSNFDTDAKYVLSNVYHDGYVYANTYGDANNDGLFSKKIVKINAETKEVVKTLDISEKLGTVKYLSCMSIVGGNTLLGGQSACGKMVAVDLETFDFIDVGLETACTYKVSEELNGKAYFVSLGVGLCEYDIATRQAKAIDSFSNANIPIRFVNNSFVAIGDDPDLPGQSLLTCSNSGPIVLYNLETGKMVKWTDITINDGTGQTIRSLANGAEGSNKIYIGAYHNSTGAIYDTETETFVGKFTTTGQTDSLLWQNGKLYAGTYANCDLVELDPDTGSSDVLFTLKKDFWQTRIHTLVAGDNRIFAGTVPDAGLHGGLLAWYDLVTQRTYVVAEEDKVFYQKADSKGIWYDAKTDAVVDLDADNDGAAEFQFKGIVENQSVMCLIYKDGYIYGTTSKYGGASTTLDDFPGEAVVFIYDVNNTRKVGEYTLNLDGISAKYISGIAFDPDFDNNGKIWGVVSETLFSFTIDWLNNKLISKEDLSYHRDDYPLDGTRYWFPRPILFGDDGYMYVGFNANGGFRRINPNNPADNKLLMTDMPMFYVLGEDGNLYYAKSAEFKMLTLNYSSQDEVSAEVVDALIKGIGEVTPESEAAITAVQNAYDALTNTQKAMVSEISALEDAQTKLVKLKSAVNGAAVDKKICF